MYDKALKRPAYYDRGVELWFERIDRGIKRRQEESRRWTKNEQFDDLRHWNGSEASGDDITINKVGAWAQTRLASMLFKNPRFVVRPVRDSGYRVRDFVTVDPQTGEPTLVSVPQYKVVENTLNFIVSQPSFGFNATLRRCAKAGLLAYGAVKTGYQAVFKDVPDESEQAIPINPDTCLPDLSGFEIDQTTGVPLRDENNRLIPRGFGPMREYWFVDWVPYRRLIIDPDGENDFYQHRWIACEQVRLLAEVKADKLLQNTKDLESTGSVADLKNEELVDDFGVYRGADTQPRLTNETIEACEAVRLFEIVDLVNKRLILLADGYGKFLRDDPLPAGIDHSPYSFFRPVERPGEFYPRPPASDLVPINDEYNKWRKQVMIGARRASRKFLRNKDALTDMELEKLMSPNDMAVADVDDAEAMESAIRPVEQPAMSGDLFAYGERIPRDFDEIAGQPAEARGLAQAKTATQVNVMEQYSLAREDDMRNILADTCRDVGKKLLDSLQANMSLKMAVAIEGPDGMLFMGEIGRVDILGDFDVSVDVTDMLPRNSDVERSQFTQLLSVLAQAPWLVAERALAGAIMDMFNIRNASVRDGLVNAAMMALGGGAGSPQGQVENAMGGAQPPPDAATMLAQMGGAR